MSRRFGGVFALTFAAQLIGNLQGLVVLPIVVRWAGPATYGAYVLVNITVAQFLPLLTTGISYRYRRNLVSATSYAERRRLFEPQFNFHLLAFVAISAFFLLAGRELDALFDTEGFYINPWALVGLVGASVIQSQVSNYFRYTLRLTPFNIALGGGPIVFVAGLAGFVAFNQALSLDQLLLVQIVSSVFVNLPFVIVMLRELGMPRVSLPLRAFARDFRAGLSLTLDLFVDFVITSGDRYLITAYLSVLDVGRYQPAYQLASVILFLPRLVVTVLSPIVSRLIDMGDRAAAERIVETSLSILLMVGVPFVAGAAMIGPSLILLLTNADVAESSRWVTPLVAVGTLFCGAIWIFETVVIGLNRPKLFLFADIEGACANLCINLVCLPLFKNITVPAIAASVGFAVAAIGLAFHLRTFWRFNIEWSALLRYCAAAAVLCGLLWLLDFRPGEVRAVGVVYLGASIAVGAAAYFAVLTMLGGFGRRQWAAIRDLLGSHAPQSTGEAASTLTVIEPPAGS